MKKTLLLIILGLTSALAFALPGHLRFRHFTVDDGLISNSARALAQDKYGFLWVGTEEGLCRYDGREVREYRLPQPCTSQFIVSLFATDNELWIGADDGLYRMNYAADSTEVFNLIATDGSRIDGVVNHFSQDADGNLWIATNGQGLYCYQPKHHTLQRYPFKEISGIVNHVLADSENQIWASSLRQGNSLYRLNKADNRFEPLKIHLKETGKPLPSCNSMYLYEDARHYLWMGTWEDGLYRIDRYTREAVRFLHPSEQPGTMHIHSIAGYSAHELLVGSDDGLLLLDTQTGKHRLYTELGDQPYTLCNRFVYPILKDHEGGFWIGTYYGGVDYIAPHMDQFESFAPLHTANSVSGTVISRFCEDRNGHIWIASDDGGLNRYNPATRHFDHFLPQEGRNSLSYHNVHGLCVDGDYLWIGTYTGGLNRLHIPSGQFKLYPTVHTNLRTPDGSSAYAIYLDNRQRLWVGTMSGINLYHRETDDFRRMKKTEVIVIDIDEDTEGRLWFSTQGRGIYRYDPVTEEWKHYQHQPADNSSLPHNQVNSLMCDQQGRLWIGTLDGLCRYRPETDNFQPVPLETPSHNICGIVEDQHILWLTTAKGLVRYVPDEASYKVFTKSDGLQSDQFIPNASFKASDGKVYVGTVRGFNAFVPYRIRTNGIVPQVHLTALEIYNHPVAVGSRQLPQALASLPELELSYEDNVFSLLFASLSYCTPEKNRYAYRLEGFDRDWNYVGSQNKATYTNLPAGTYTFHVKASNNDGLWNEEGARLRIIIHPPFYLSTGFKVIYVILFFVALFFVIRYFLHKADKKHQAEIDRLNETKELEMHEAKIKFFTTIAHEIRTPVSLIIGPLEKVMRGTMTIPPAVRNDLEIIDRNSQRLLTLVNQLLDFRKVEQGTSVMHFTTRPISELLRAVCVRFEPSIRQQGAVFTADYPAGDFRADVDPEGLTKVISNLLTNASKYTRTRVHLSCEVDMTAQTFTVSVADDGLGISPEEQKKIFRPFYQSMDNKPGTGIGLSIVQSIVEAHHGELHLASETGKGSTFSVTFPIRQEVLKTMEGDENGDGNGTGGNGSPAGNGTGNQGAEGRLSDDRLPADILPLPGGESAAGRQPVMLIVDDNEEMVRFLASGFAGQYTVVTAGDGLEALEQLDRQEVTLIVSDWMMPRMDGVDFCKTVRNNPATSHIPFVLLTAKTDINSKIEGMDCGADIYVEKPFSVQYLEACIKNLVEMRRLLRQKFSQMPLVPITTIASTPMDDDFLSRMNVLIEENFANPDLNVEFLARELCISRSSLFAKIKTLASVTPNELIQLVRLKKAASLLAENKYRIGEISYMVGFNNASYFSKCFQKQFGMKPGEFVNNQAGVCE